jgi:hypothetical protein
MQRDSYFETADLNLVASLLSLGILPNSDNPFVKIKTVKGEQYKFFLQESSQCGTYHTGDMIKAWSDPDFANNNPEHPFAYMKCANLNREGLLDVVKKSEELVVIEKNGKIAVINKNASKEFQDKIFSQI